MALLARLFMASFLLFDGPHVSVAGEVVTVTSTSIATAFSDCTCALTVSDHLTEYKVSTTSVNVAPPFTTEPTRSAFPATSVSYPNWSTTSEPTRTSIIAPVCRPIDFGSSYSRIFSFDLPDSHQKPDIYRSIPSAN
ncbi:hypothetical protein PENSUB_5126 [Penicillium subrubescens]|uniref:Secreted protein n=1 Tax=Penicillium subrubescens TaxID=1316194 RepID=A0A1Q5UAM8_9EURO|nr:hypothetical protein PENSUB_5126 [Penicillium subrubescens]